ncbi:hypothetical protein [Hyphomicrobium sp. ghe19]|uniref:hypothetical protein n=1 Tax=Hyphomicrobium sp. ghe19 TaxID=2682968 RepID=UPI001367278A|nr:hypothetical protein HYPP_02433 [Hyphomicrobium sp. ghe19]
MSAHLHTKRFHVEVRIRENQIEVWKPVRPSRGEPYVFTEDEAQQYLETHILTSGAPDRFRMVEAQ